MAEVHTELLRVMNELYAVSRVFPVPFIVFIPIILNFNITLSFPGELLRSYTYMNNKQCVLAYGQV